MAADEEVCLADAAGAETPLSGLAQAAGDDDQPTTSGQGSGAARSPTATPTARVSPGAPPEEGVPRPLQLEGAAAPLEPCASGAENGSWTEQGVGAGDDPAGLAADDSAEGVGAPRGSPAEPPAVPQAALEENEAPTTAAAPLPDLELGGPGIGAPGAAEAPASPAGSGRGGAAVPEADPSEAAQASEADAGGGSPTPSLLEAEGPAKADPSEAAQASEADAGGGSPTPSLLEAEGPAKVGQSSIRFSLTACGAGVGDRVHDGGEEPALGEACGAGVGDRVHDGGEEPALGEAAPDDDEPRDSGYPSPCSNDDGIAQEESLFEHLGLSKQVSTPPPKAFERNASDSSASADFKVTGSHSEVSACESELPPSPEEAVANSPRLFQARGLGPRSWPRTWPADLAVLGDGREDGLDLEAGASPSASAAPAAPAAPAVVCDEDLEEDLAPAALSTDRWEAHAPSRTASPPLEDLGPAAPSAGRWEAHAPREDGAPADGTALCPRSPPPARPLSCPPGLGSGAPADQRPWDGADPAGDASSSGTAPSPTATLVALTPPATAPTPTRSPGERCPSCEKLPVALDRRCSEDSESLPSVAGDMECAVTQPRSFVTRRGHGDSAYTSGGASSSSSGLPTGSRRKQVVAARSRDPLVGSAVYQVFRGSSRALHSWLGDLSGLSSEALERAHRVHQDTLERWQEDMPSWSDMERWQGEISACADKQAKALQEIIDERVRWALQNWDLNREKAKARLLDISRPARETMLGSMKDMIKSSALADPDMWSWARECIEACLSKVLDDLEHEIEVNIEAALLKQRQQDELEGPCADSRASWYRRLPVTLYFKVRRFVLHHYLPHNRSIYGKVYDPVYVAILLLTLAPVPFVRVIFFTVLLLMIVIPGPPDEFQLVNFILLFKGTQFLNALSTMARGSMEYFVCFSARKDALLACVERSGPGGSEQLLSGLMDFLGSCVLVWIAFRLLPYSRKAVQTRFVGRHDDEVPVESDEEQDEPEFETCCCGRCRYRLIKTKGGRLGQLLKWDVKAFVLSNVALMALAVWTSRLDAAFAQQGAADWLHHSPQFKQDLFWCKVLYGLLSLPFLPFSISFLCKVLTHCEWTGFNEKGACVAFELEPRPYWTRRARSSTSWRHCLRKAMGRCGRSRAPSPEYV